MLNKLIIYEYIVKLKKDDIYTFGLKQGINLTDNEIDIIYDYIKNRYDDIMNKPDEIFAEIKDKINNTTYQKILELYNKYKNKIS